MINFANLDLNILGKCQASDGGYKLATNDVKIIEQVLDFWKKNFWQNETKVRFNDSYEFIYFNSSKHLIHRVALWYEAAITIDNIYKKFAFNLLFVKDNGDQEVIASVVNCNCTNNNCEESLTLYLEDKKNTGVEDADTFQSEDIDIFNH